MINLRRTGPPRGAGIDTTSCGRVDLVVLTVTPIELRAARDVLASSCQFLLDGNRRYFPATVHSRQLGRDLSILVTSAHAPHNVQSNQAVNDVIRFCDPHTVFLVGVAAGDRSRLRLADIVIPQAVTFYDAERLGPTAAQPRHDTLPIPGTMRANLTYFQAEPTGFTAAVNALLADLPTADRPPRLPEDFAPRIISQNTIIATGAKLLADQHFLPQLRHRYDQRLVAADQDSWGFAQANHEQRPWAIFRGISDHADPHKHDHWQYLAASCATLGLKVFLEQQYLPEPHQTGRCPCGP